MTHDIDRDDRMAELLEEYPPGLNGYAFTVDAPRTKTRFVFIERSTIDGSHYLTAHGSPEDAARYWEGNKYPEDWEPVVLVDLETGRRLDPTVRVTFS